MNHSFEILKSRVFVLTDNENRITRCEGEYTLENIGNMEEWTQIDTGYGDRCNLAQSHYFEGGLYTEDGIPRYKLVNDESNGYGVAPVLRTEEELAADRAALPAPEPSREEELEAEIAKLRRDNEMLEECLVEIAEIVYA